jgi:MFS family permease
VGPLLGGWLIENVSWRVVFLINVPIASAVLLIAARWMPESRDAERDRRVDWRGVGPVTVGLAAIVYGLIESSRSGVHDPSVSLALAGGMLSLVAFVAIEARTPNAMLPLGLFRSANFTGANLVTLFLYAALGGGMFFIPLNFIQVQGYSASDAGAALLPFILIVFLVSRSSGRLVNRHGARVPLAAGSLLAALGYALLMRAGIGGGYWASFFPGIATLGLGMAVSITPLTTTVMDAVGKDRAGGASGVNNAVARTAGLLGVAALGIVIFHVSARELDHRLTRLEIAPDMRRRVEQQREKLAGADLPADVDEETRVVLRRAIDESFIVGFRAVLSIAAALAVASALTEMLMVRDASRM